MIELTRPLVSIDIESTGVDPVADYIVEFGAVVLDVDGTRRSWQQRFKPPIPIPAEAIAVHGITNEDVADKPAFAAMAPHIQRAMTGKDICGFNLFGIDLPMLDEELRRAGQAGLDISGVRIVDGFSIFQQREPRNLEAAVKKYCNRSHEGAHGALADAEASLDVILRQQSLYGIFDLDGLAQESKRDGRDIVDLAGKLYRDADGDICYAFGKSRGVKVRDDQSFAMWILGKGFSGSTKDALMAELKRIQPRPALREALREALK